VRQAGRGDSHGIGADTLCDIHQQSTFSGLLRVSTLKVREDAAVHEDISGGTAFPGVMTDAGIQGDCHPALPRQRLHDSGHGPVVWLHLRQDDHGPEERPIQYDQVGTAPNWIEGR
jgi:hypothetical protein